MGIQVSIMLPYDPRGEKGPKLPLPDVVKVHEPKEEESVVPIHGASQAIPVPVALPPQQIPPPTQSPIPSTTQ